MANTDEVLNPLTVEREKQLVQAAKRYLGLLFSKSHRPITAMEEFINPLRELGSESAENMTIVSNNIMNLTMSREVANSDTRTAEVLNVLSDVANTFEKLGSKSSGASARYIRRVMKNQDIMRAASTELSKLRSDVNRILLSINQHKERSLKNLDFMRECLHYVETLNVLYEEDVKNHSLSPDNQQRFVEVMQRKKLYLMEALTVGTQSCLTFTILQERFFNLQNNLESARTILIPAITNAITLQIAIAEGQAEESELENISIQADAELLGLDEVEETGIKAFTTQMKFAVRNLIEDSSSEKKGESPNKNETSSGMNFFFKKKTEYKHDMVYGDTPESGESLEDSNETLTIDDEEHEHV